MQGNRARHATVAVEETEDVVHQTQQLLAYLHSATRDGRIDGEEQQTIYMLAELVLTEALEAVTAAERADVGELLSLAYLKGEEPSLRVVNRAHELGFRPASYGVVELFPQMPKDAA